MATLPVSLDALIDYVRELNPAGGPLDRLTDAVVVSNQMGEQSDALVGYFVDQARASGAPWSRIGTAMGVSKQAAQKRFVLRDEEGNPDGRTFSRFTPRARLAVAAAGVLAGAEAVDAAHLAAGSLLDPDGLAARAVARLGVAEDGVYEALGVGPATDGGDNDPAALRELHFTGAGRDALKEGLKAALRLGHNYIGTEHLLLGVAAGRNEVAPKLEAMGLGPGLIESAVSIEVAQAQLRMRRPRG